MELLGALLLLGILALPVVAAARWALRVLESAADGRALRAWFSDHGTDFCYGVVPVEHALFAPIASKLSREPDPPGSVETCSLWFAGRGDHHDRPFTFTGHSPSHSQFPPTWRLFLEGHTGLESADVLVICSRESKVFLDGALAKKSLRRVSLPPEWRWAEVFSNREDQTSEWLTPDRGQALQDVLKPGRALQVYSDFVVGIQPGKGAVPLVTSVLGCRDVLFCAAAPGRAGPESADTEATALTADRLRERVNWLPLPAPRWQTIDSDTGGPRWSLHEPPNYTWEYAAAAFASAYLLITALNAASGTFEPTPTFVLGVLIGALVIWVWRRPRDQGHVAELDFGKQTLRIGTGQSLEGSADLVCHDLSRARALQVLQTVSQTSSHGSHAGKSTVRELFVSIVLEDGSRIPLATFDGPDFWDHATETLVMPSLVDEVLEATDWWLLRHA